MLRTKTLTRSLSSVAVATCVAAACSGGDQPSPTYSPTEETATTGSIGLALTVAPGITIDSVGFTVDGSGMSAMSGNLAAGDGTGNTFVALLRGIPAGPARHVTLSAKASDGTVCVGEATADVIAGQTTEVAVRLDCRGDGGGAILVNGTLDQCPRIRTLMAAPATAPVGSKISVSATATDADDPINIMWTASSGSFESPTSASTHFMCASPGTVQITATVTDTRGCAEAASVNVTCTPATPACGNGTIEPPEMCDGSNLNGETCASATMNSRPNGVLTCSSSCTLDTSGCMAADAGAGGSGGVGGTMGSGGATGGASESGGTGGSM
jgi:hypothetical protein